jgi:hypothetical protein
MKPLTCIAALGAGLLMTHSAVAASAVAKVCAADIKAQCADVKPGGGALKDCVKAHFSDLSADCQVTIGPRGGGWQSLQGRRQEVLRRRQIRQGGDCGLHEGAYCRG